jgi:hypothetical protein
MIGSVIALQQAKPQAILLEAKVSRASAKKSFSASKKL